MSRRNAGPRAPRAPTAAERYRADRLRLRHLRLLEGIERTGSLRQAAARVGVSQPAASLLLRELEAVFAAPLVIRNARGCRLSPQGAEALERLSIALASVDRAVGEARDGHGPPGLKLGTVQLAGLSLLPATLARLEERGDPVRVDIREGRANDLLRSLVAGELDGVIGWVDQATVGSLPLDRLRIRPLWQGRMEVVAAASHPLARRASAAIADLQRCRWVVAHEGTRMHAGFVMLFAQAGAAAPAPTVECSALHTALNIVAATRLLAIVPDIVAAAYARSRSIRVLRGRDFATEASSVSLITRRDSDALPSLERFRDALLASASPSFDARSPAGGGRPGRAAPTRARMRR